MKSQCIEMNIKQKVRTQMRQVVKIQIVNKLFVFIYSGQDDNAKLKDIIYQKRIIKNYSDINLYDQPINSDRKK